MLRLDCMRILLNERIKETNPPNGRWRESSIRLPSVCIIHTIDTNSKLFNVLEKHLCKVQFFISIFLQSERITKSWLTRKMCRVSDNMPFITTVVCLVFSQEMLVRIQLMVSKPLLRSCNFSQYKTFPEYLSTPVQRILNRRFQYKGWKFIGSFRKRFAFVV